MFHTQLAKIKTEPGFKELYKTKDIQGLIKYFSNPENFDPDSGMITLFLAVSENSLELVKLFLTYKVMQELTPNITAAFHRAVENGKIAIAEILFPYINLYPEKLKETFYLALRHGHTEVVKYLLSKPQVDVSANKAILMAAQYNHRNIVILLLLDSRLNKVQLENDLKSTPLLSFGACEKLAQKSKVIQQCVEQIENSWARYRLFRIGRTEENSLFSKLPKEIIELEIQEKIFRVC